MAVMLIPVCQNQKLTMIVKDEQSSSSLYVDIVELL